MLNRLKEMWSSQQPVAAADQDDDAAVYMTREKVLVFVVSFFLAFCLWFIVNLSRDFNITIHLPIEIGNLPEDMALVDDPPTSASVGLIGEGWKLISLYSNPPSIMVNVEQQEVNLFDIVQQQVSVISEVTVTRVQPNNLILNLEQKVEKRVPVEADVYFSTRDRYGLVGEPELSPDSVTVIGASSMVDRVDRLLTSAAELDDVWQSGQIELRLDLEGLGITASPSSVTYAYEITEFTEGEVRIPVRVRNIPPGRSVTFSPSSITVRYFVPIDQYGEVQNLRPFNAYVDYATIEEDTTGQVTPEVERVEDDYDVQLRTFQPRSVSYFEVVDNS